jgi:hypothetical protein
MEWNGKEWNGRERIAMKFKILKIKNLQNNFLFRSEEHFGESIRNE